MKTNKKNKHRGSTFDDFLKEEGIYEEVCASAAKRVLAAQMEEALAEKHKTISQLARDMKTSRAVVQRLLDKKNYSLSLRTLVKAATALGKRVKLELVEA